MLMVGYRGNHYIVKNSWGDGGYCHLPHNALMAQYESCMAFMLLPG